MTRPRTVTLDYFLGYESSDKEFAQQVHRKLVNVGLRGFFFPADTKLGDSITETIDQAIKASVKGIVIFNPSVLDAWNSRRRKWVISEIKALYLKRKNIIPILNGVRPQDLPLELLDLVAVNRSDRRLFDRVAQSFDTPLRSLVEEVIALKRSLDRLGKAAPGFLHDVRFAMGAAYGLRQAIALGHFSRKDYATFSEHVRETAALARAIESTMSPPDRWQAGFHYNSAILRMCAFFLRLLKAVGEPFPPTKESRQFSIREVERARRTAVSVLATRSGDKTLLNHVRTTPHIDIITREVSRLLSNVQGHTKRHAAREGRDDVETLREAARELSCIASHPQIVTMMKRKFPTGIA